MCFPTKVDTISDKTSKPPTIAIFFGGKDILCFFRTINISIIDEMIVPKNITKVFTKSCEIETLGQKANGAKIIVPKNILNDNFSKREPLFEFTEGLFTVEFVFEIESGL